MSAARDMATWAKIIEDQFRDLFKRMVALESWQEKVDEDDSTARGRLSAFEENMKQFGRELGAQHDQYIATHNRLTQVEGKVLNLDREVGELSTSLENTKEVASFAHYRLDSLTGARSTPAAIQAEPAPEPLKPVSVPLKEDMLRPGLIVRLVDEDDPYAYRMIVRCATHPAFQTIASDGDWGSYGKGILQNNYVTATDRGPFGTAGVLWHEVAPAGMAVEVGSK